MLREQKVVETMPDGEYILKVCPGLVVQCLIVQEHVFEDIFHAEVF